MLEGKIYSIDKMENSSVIFILFIILSMENYLLKKIPGNNLVIFHISYYFLGKSYENYTKSI